MDVLNDVLQTVALSGTMLYRGSLFGDWGIRFPPAQRAQCDASFHVVVSGDCLLHVCAHDSDDEQDVTLASGDFVVLPHGSEHTLRAAKNSRVAPLEMLLPLADGDSARGLRYRSPDCPADALPTVTLCGKLQYESASTNPLLAALPTMIHVHGDMSGHAQPWLRDTISFLHCELESERPGALSIVRRLTEVIFVQAVRAHLSALTQSCLLSSDSKETGGGGGWLRALVDARIGPALRAIHESPSRDWTVGELAAHCAMSRSAFAQRFADIVGEPPLQYVARWRMHRAAVLLTQSGNEATVGGIARASGYTSEAAFSRVFKRWHGVAPGGYRRRGTAP